MVSSAISVSEGQQVDTLQATAKYFFDTHQYDLAATQLRSLLEHPTLDAQSRIEIISRLVLAAAHSAPEEAIRLSVQLPEVGIIENVDMDKLEEMLCRRDYLKHATTPSTQGDSMETESMEPEMDIGNVRKIVCTWYKELLSRMPKRSLD